MPRLGAIYCVMGRHLRQSVKRSEGRSAIAVPAEEELGSARICTG